MEFKPIRFIVVSSVSSVLLKLSTDRESETGARPNGRGIVARSVPIRFTFKMPYLVRLGPIRDRRALIPTCGVGLARPLAWIVGVSLTKLLEPLKCCGPRTNRITLDLADVERRTSDPRHLLEVRGR
jgi:hypothetical protein